MKRTYITAVRQLINAGHEPTEVIAGLVRTLATRGHSKLLGAILRGVLSETAGVGTAAPQVRVVSAASAAAVSADIERSLKTLATTGEHEIIVDKNIIGGYIVETRTARIDASYRRALIELYRSITK